MHGFSRSGPPCKGLQPKLLDLVCLFCNILKVYFIFYMLVHKCKIVLFMTTWMDPETITLSKISPMEKVENRMTSLLWDMELKATNSQDNQTSKTHGHRQEFRGYHRVRENVRELEASKGGQKHGDGRRTNSRW